jgi:hypothetical protein
MKHEVAPAVFVIHEVAAVREAIHGVFLRFAFGQDPEKRLCQGKYRGAVIPASKTRS